MCKYVRSLFDIMKTNMYQYLYQLFKSVREAYVFFNIDIALRHIVLLPEVLAFNDKIIQNVWNKNKENFAEWNLTNDFTNVVIQSFNPFLCAFCSKNSLSFDWNCPWNLSLELWIQSYILRSTFRLCFLYKVSSLNMDCVFANYQSNLESVSIQKIPQASRLFLFEVKTTKVSMGLLRP